MSQELDPQGAPSVISDAPVDEDQFFSNNNAAGKENTSPEEAEEEPTYLGALFRDDAPWSVPIPEQYATVPTVAMPTLHTLDAIDFVTQQKAVLEEASGNKTAREWGVALIEGTDHATAENGLKQCLRDEKAQWEQGVQIDGRTVRAMYVQPSYKPGIALTGNAARTRLLQATGQGLPVISPMWHSGFYIGLRRPKQNDLLELHRIIEQNKAQLGRTTYGRIYSNYVYYMVQVILESIERHIHSVSFTPEKDKRVLDYLNVNDIPILVASYAALIWPRGFKLDRGCVSDPGKCYHVVKELCNILRMIRVNVNALTEKQKRHWCVTKDQTLESIAAYQADFGFAKTKVIKVHPNVSIMLRLPDSVKYINAGYYWINTIHQTYTEAMIQNEQRRARYLVEQSRINSMREWAHYVGQIVINDNEVYEGVEDIAAHLDTLSSFDGVPEKFAESVKSFINETTIATVAIPSFICPACGGKQDPLKELKHFPDLIAVDPLSTFFTLLTREREIRLDI